MQKRATKSDTFGHCLGHAGEEIVACYHFHDEVSSALAAPQVEARQERLLLAGCCCQVLLDLLMISPMLCCVTVEDACGGLCIIIILAEPNGNQAWNSSRKIQEVSLHWHGCTHICPGLTWMGLLELHVRSTCCSAECLCCCFRLNVHI